MSDKIEIFVETNLLYLNNDKTNITPKLVVYFNEADVDGAADGAQIIFCRNLNENLSQ